MLILAYFLKHLQKTLQINSFFLIFLNYLIVSLYFFLKENVLFSEMEKSSIIKTVLPRISYLLAFSSVFFNVVSYKKMSSFPKETKFSYFLLPFLISSLMIFGKNAFILCLLLMLIVILYTNAMKRLGLSSNIQTYVYLSAISFYFWYAFGNKPQIAALQVINVYVGFEHFNYYASGILLIINCGASFLLVMLSIPAINGLLKNDEKDLFENNKKNEEVKKLKYLRDIIYYGIYFLATLMCTSANCIVQRRALLLIEDFAPKFFFDGCIFSVVNFLLLIILIIFVC